MFVLLKKDTTASTQQLRALQPEEQPAACITYSLIS